MGDIEIVHHLAKAAYATRLLCSMVARSLASGCDHLQPNFLRRTPAHVYDRWPRALSAWLFSDLHTIYNRLHAIHCSNCIQGSQLLEVIFHFAIEVNDTVFSSHSNSVGPKPFRGKKFGSHFNMLRARASFRRSSLHTC
ncbi:hypothetical protein [Cupriavidus basilensis]|uniref:hypothetical protein n=1 Tax=Cupriavidus basilensis TaxID=68895 RepID=UPI0023E8EEAC|nr:hypothetical protein [Cupriavidus basilensis]MDF3883146.1 hypothetical protein [Cupriavidus basilensis]